MINAMLRKRTRRIAFASPVILLLMLAPAFAQRRPLLRTTVFYVVAHQDDWQLFMNPNAWNDVRPPGGKVVFVYTTAGDAGLGKGSGDRSIPYYIAREEGARRAVRFLADAGRVGEDDRWDSVVLNGKTLPRNLYKNTVSYFLRLPDGNFNGAGFPSTGNQSLRRLYEGRISTLTSVDGALKFQGWADLVDTLRELTVHEAGGSANVWVNVPDPREEINRVDHSDHRHSGIGMLEAIHKFPCIHTALFVNYATAWMPRNLDADAAAVEAAVWGVTASGLSDAGHLNSFDRLHGSWLGRNYFRVERGIGRCSFGP